MGWGDQHLASPLPTGQAGETCCCLLPLHHAQIHPAWARGPDLALAWGILHHGHGAKGIQGEKGLLGSWGSLPLPGMGSPAQVPLV